MKVKEILEFLYGLAPKELAEGFDNVGLLVGDENAEVKGIMVSLDCFDEVIDRAEDLGANLIVTHHPLIFRAPKAVTTDDPVAYVQELEPTCELEVTYNDDGSIVIKLDHNGLWVKYEFTED